MDNSEIFSLFLDKTYCDPSLEPSQRDGSNDGSQCIFYEKKKTEKIP